MIELKRSLLRTGRTASLAQNAIAPGDLARLALVMFLWALCFPLIAAGLVAAPPLYYAALRSVVAGVALLIPAFVLGRPLPRGRSAWLGLFGVGLFATSLGFAGMFLAGGIVSPGLATVLANVQPLIAAVLAYLILSEKLGPRRRIGLSIGFAGILLIALPGFGAANANSTPLGLAFIALAAVGVAVGNVLLKRLTGKVDLLMATGWQFILGSAPLFLVSQITEAPVRVDWSPAFIGILLALSLLGTALAFALWFSVLHRSELTRLNTFTFLTPGLALLIGFAFFAESLGLVELSGVALVLGGVWWVSRS